MGQSFSGEETSLISTCRPRVVVLLPYIDSFSNIQTMVGLVGAGDTVDFLRRLQPEYTVVTNPDGSITVRLEQRWRAGMGQ